MYFLRSLLVLGNGGLAHSESRMVVLLVSIGIHELRSIPFFYTNDFRQPCPLAANSAQPPLYFGDQKRSDAAVFQ